MMANSVDPDQTAPREAVWSGSEQSDQGLHCLLDLSVRKLTIITIIMNILDIFLL